ncbi:Hint domain-containing protein [Salibaculum sp.]|uniref:Hint domain-containing protein n=1 Tax=Salibaculum sp. TaxID=2855480 RepID=UPI002B4A2CE1|nr:Hint domain-containing protein [Salibaculum sp.]HKL68306.1 Hint domain-containing protein [Salibaculum sp.]
MQQDLRDKTADPIAQTTTFAGLTAGTIVLTLQGEALVEDLVPGCKVITRDTGVAVLKELRRQDATLAPVEIKAGSLGHTRPGKTMLLGAETRLHVRDWRAKALFGTEVATVKAHRLLDGEFVRQLAPRRLTLWEPVFDDCHILYADGLEVASAAD